MNKARMTFRFEEGQRRELDPLGEEQPVIAIDPPPIKEEPQKAAPIHTNDKIAIVPKALEEWGDPFSKDDNWEELLSVADRYPLEKSNERRYQYQYAPFDERDELDDLNHLKNLYKPDEEDNYVMNHSFSEEKEEDYGYYRHRRPTSWWKMIGTVTGAVVTGALFGFVLLSLFKGGTDGVMGTQTKGVDQSAEVSATVSSGDDGRAGLTVKIEPQSYYMLQYGVFSSADRVEQAKAELEQYGIAAGNDPGEEYRVYAGISPDREQAKLLSNQLKNQGVELYVREVDLPAVTAVRYKGNAETINEYFDISGQLVASLSKMSSELLGREQPEALSTDEINSITDLHQKWTEAVKSLETGLSSEELPHAKQLEQTMNSALSSVSEYKKNAAKGHLWEIQSCMMKYIILQKQLVDTIGI